MKQLACVRLEMEEWLSSPLSFCPCEKMGPPIVHSDIVLLDRVKTLTVREDSVVTEFILCGRVCP